MEKFSRGGESIQCNVLMPDLCSWSRVNQERGGDSRKNRSRGQVTWWGLLGPCDDFGFYSEGDEKPWDHCELREEHNLHINRATVDAVLRLHERKGQDGSMASY